MGILDDAIRQHLELKRQHGAPEEEVSRQEEEALGPARRDVAAAEPAGDEAELEAAEDTPAAEAETELFDAQETAAADADAPFGGGDAEAEARAGTASLDETETGFESEPAGDEAEADLGSELGRAAERESDLGLEREPAEREPAAQEPDFGFDSDARREPDAEREPDFGFDSDARREPDDDEDVGVPEPDAMPPSAAPFDASTAFEEFGRDAPGEEEDEEEEDDDEGDVLEDTPDFLQDAPEHDRLWFEQKPPRDFDFD